VNGVGEQGIIDTFCIEILIFSQIHCEIQVVLLFSLGEFFKSVLLSSNIMPDIKISSFVYSGIASLSDVC
jgi:hypothetical protein